MGEPQALFPFLCTLLVPFAAGGISLINAGLSRSRSAAHAMLASLVVAAVALLAYALCGFLVARSSGIVLLLQLFSVGIAAMIPLAAGAERWRIGASSISTAVFAGWTYPLFAHWVWSGGWLARQGFLDAGGSSCIQGVGGLTALAIAWILGPRRGKYTPDGIPAAIPGHNAVIVLFGCMLALTGWIGLNTAGAMLFANANPNDAVSVAVNTALGAAAAALTALAVTRLRFGKPDASLTANGWVSGLVASSAGCAVLKPAEAVLIGIVAGALVIFGIEVLELRMKVDDPGGAISVHGVAGIWGVVAAGIFGPSQLLPQLVGVATLIGCVLPMSYALNWLLDRIIRQRVAVEGERQGMDLFELGAGAYPDFVTQREDLFRR
jgi:Amt family ammonium transporter